MMLNFVRGNLFESHAEALVNTVNCVGIMGKGIAYQFRRAYPAYHEDYVRRCKQKEVRLGSVYSYRERGKVIVSFPTKQHWKSKSKLADVDAGLGALRSLIKSENLAVVAIPPLGCGNGGLAWADVKPLIQRHLGDLDDVEIQVFEPAGSFESRVAEEPRVSLAHFVLAALRVGLQQGNKLNLQKSAYFFNVFAEADYFRFTEYKYGPYCVGIDPMSNAIKDYLAYTGIKVDQMVDDGLHRRLSGQDADRLRQWLPVVDRVHAFCNRNSADLEALATAHAVIAKHGPILADAVVSRFLAWSDEKSERFRPPDVHRAVATLEREGLVVRGLLGFDVVREAPPSEPSQAASEVAGSMEVPADLARELRSQAQLRGLDAQTLLREAIEGLLHANSPRAE